MKKKIFIVGSAPLPTQREGIREAAGLRTHQFVSPLQKENHEIVLIAISNSPEPENTNGFPEKTEEKGNTKIFWISRHSQNLTRFLQQQIIDFSPDVAIGVNTFPAYILSTILPKNIPFWADLNGWIMAEAQARGWQENTNVSLANAYRQERQILSTADKISTVSTAQKFSTLGEMSAQGFLHKENFLEERIFAIPNGTEFFDIDTAKTDTNMLFRKILVPEDAFVIAWIGGYNNWVDEESLFYGVEKAMQNNPHIYFVSTGGAIKNIANTTFSAFQNRIKQSAYKNRFVFLGWIETKDMQKIYKESDIGINIDLKCVETQTGARNRINEMLKFQLPVITTKGSEIAESVEKYGAGKTIPEFSGEKDLHQRNIANAIQDMQSLSELERKRMGENGLTITQEVFALQILQQPVLQFVHHPQKTTHTRVPLESLFFFWKNIFFYIRRNSYDTVIAKIKQRIL